MTHDHDVAFEDGAPVPTEDFDFEAVFARDEGTDADAVETARREGASAMLHHMLSAVVGGLETTPRSKRAGAMGKKFATIALGLLNTDSGHRNLAKLAEFLGSTRSAVTRAKQGVRNKSKSRNAREH